MEVKVSAGGRIVIPKEIRDRLRIKEGDRILLEVRNREIILKPCIDNPVNELYGSIPVKPEDSPKKVAREWMRRRLEKLDL